MQTSIHIFHKPEEAEAFMAGINQVNDDLLHTELVEPNEVSVEDHGCDEDSPDQFFDHRLQISDPTITTTHPDLDPSEH